MGSARVGTAALAQERHLPRRQAPAPLGPGVGVGVPPDPHLVVGLVDEAQRHLARALVAVELDGRAAGEEEALRSRLDQDREVAQGVGLAEGAVGAAGGEDHDHRLDVVLGHGDRVASAELLDLDDVVDLLRHLVLLGPRPCSGARHAGSVMLAAGCVARKPPAPELLDGLVAGQRGAVHVSARVGLVGRRPVQHAAVVPDHEVAVGPLVDVDPLGPRRPARSSSKSALPSSSPMPTTDLAVTPRTSEQCPLR